MSAIVAHHSFDSFQIRFCLMYCFCFASSIGLSPAARPSRIICHASLGHIGNKALTEACLSFCAAAVLDLETAVTPLVGHVY